MTRSNRRLGVIVALGLALATVPACKRETPSTAGPDVPKDETADAFIARVNAEYSAMYPELTASQWLSSTYISEDSKLLAAKGNERFLTQLNAWLAQARRFEGKPMSAQTARAITLLKQGTAMPPPRDPAKLAQLTRIASAMEGSYGAGEYCRDVEGATRCRQLGDLEKVLATDRDYDDQLDAWQGWQATARPIRGEYAQFVTLVNEGARDMGYADAGEMWRSGYDMSPAEFAADTDRLWNQVKPLYQQLHCYARTRLQARYQGQGAVGDTGMLPAHLLGNMWQQDWSNRWDVLAPYPDAGSLDITAALQKQSQSGLNDRLLNESETMPATREADVVHLAAEDQARRMTERAQDFYVSLGMPKLPPSYWQRSQFTKPRDRNVVCHASAWDMDMSGDVRTKMCITPDEEDFTTIYHELGHVYYYLAYNGRPALFQAGANDGFHEAIGDTIVLAMTPQYLSSINLVDAPAAGNEALVNAQMRMALSKVAFLPFGLMIDRWRWGVFDGSIKPSEYNAAWWRLKAQYQGVAPATPRGEEFFDAGAKYHVPANTPYTRYFLSHILQFQFYKALCDASGHTGPLYDCSFYGNKVAGQKFWSMLNQGASQPWPQTMQQLTGSGRIDAQPLLEYFAPLQTWLTQQNEGQTCGWTLPTTAKRVPPATAARPAPDKTPPPSPTP